MYFLKETADKIQATENDILRRAMLSNNDGSFFSDSTDVFLSIWYTGFLWKRSTEYVLGGLREWNGLLDIRPVDVPMILTNLKPVYLSSFIERHDQYIALESRPAGQSFEIDPYIITHIAATGSKPQKFLGAKDAGTRAAFIYRLVGNERPVHAQDRLSPRLLDNKLPAAAAYLLFREEPDSRRPGEQRSRRCCHRQSGKTAF